MINITRHQGNSKTTHNELSGILTGMTTMNRTITNIIKVGEDVEQLELFYMAGRGIDWFNHSGR
jgi:hypothetical protein